MKKLLILIISLVVFIPNIKAIELEKLGLTIDLDESYTIYTRKDKNRLYDYYKKDIYLEAYDNQGDILYIRAITNPGLNNYKVGEDQVDAVVSLGRRLNVETYRYVDVGDYRWIKFDYYNKDSKHIIEYYLCWNDLFLTVTIQPQDGNELSEGIQKTSDNIVKTIKLTGTGRTDGIHVDEKYIDKLDKFKFIKKYGIEILLCLGVIGFAYYFKHKKREE
jgi:hypothetical protein